MLFKRAGGICFSHNQREMHSKGNVKRQPRGRGKGWCDLIPTDLSCIGISPLLLGTLRNTQPSTERMFSGYSPPHPFFPFLFSLICLEIPLFASLVSITSLTQRHWGEPSVSGLAMEVQLSPAVGSSVFALPLFFGLGYFFFPLPCPFLQKQLTL